MPIAKSGINPKFALGIPEIMRDELKELKSETLQRRSGGAMT
jgi:hypothetical protein